MSKIVTLLTDFGVEDPYVGMMKGVIYAINATVQLVDLSHSVQPQQIQQGAFLLFNSYRYFPASTVHLAVVDPGVGTERRAVAVQISEVGTFVGPDNGLFSYILEAELARGTDIMAVELLNSTYQLPQPSATFHGRDIFAPAAAYLSKGVPLTELGPVIPYEQLVRFETKIPEWQPKKAGQLLEADGQIVHIDHFGNLITNLPAPLFETLTLQQKRKLQVKCKYSRNLITLHGLNRTYAEKAPTRNWFKLINLISSGGYLEIACANGNAKQLLQAEIGDKVRVQVPLDVP